MTQEKNKELFTQLEKKFSELTQKNELKLDNKGRYILRNMFATLPNEQGLILFETTSFSVLQGVNQMGIDVTLDIDVDKRYMAEVERAILNLNYYAPLGTFGIHYPSKKVFHRYTYLLDEKKQTSEIVDDTVKIYEIAAGVIGQVFETLNSLANGEMTFDDAVKKNLVLTQ